MGTHHRVLVERWVVVRDLTDPEVHPLFRIFVKTFISVHAYLVFLPQRRQFFVKCFTVSFPNTSVLRIHPLGNLQLSVVGDVVCDFVGRVEQTPSRQGVR